MVFIIKIDGILLWCVEKDNTYRIIRDLHAGHANSDFRGETMMHKITKERCYCPNLFKDDHTFSRKCKYCQNAAGRVEKLVVPLQPIVMDTPIQQWVWILLVQ